MFWHYIYWFNDIKPWVIALAEVHLTFCQGYDIDYLIFNQKLTEILILSNFVNSQCTLKWKAVRGVLGNGRYSKSPDWEVSGGWMGARSRLCPWPANCSFFAVPTEWVTHTVRLVTVAQVSWCWVLWDRHWGRCQGWLETVTSGGLEGCREACGRNLWAI